MSENQPRPLDDRRRSAIRLVLCAALLGSMASTAAATTFVVNSAADELGVNVGNRVCETAPGSGVCTLRRALAEANLLFLEDPGGPDVALPAVTIVLAVPGGVIDLTPGSGLPAVKRRGDLTVIGTGMSSTVIDGHGANVFLADGDCRKVVRLAALTVRHAGIALEGCGALQLDYTALTDSTLGVIWVQGDAVMTGVDISRNGLPGAGGGVFFTDGGPMIRRTLHIRRSVLQDNRGLHGAAIIAQIGGVTLDGVTLSGNSATGSGGAVFVSGYSALSAINTTFSGNSAGAAGGAVFVEGRSLITASPEAGSAVLVHSTLTRNRADANADGIGSGGGVATAIGLLGSMGILTLDHTIVAANEKTTFNGTSWVVAPGDCGGAVQLAGPTVMSIADCTVAGGSPIVGSANLDVLRNDGGPTPTHPLLSGSVAIDAGDATCHDVTGAALTVDQRGYLRPAGTRCDVGAYEFQAAMPVKAQPRDLNGDGRADLLWRHAGTGQNAVWFMNGSAVIGGGLLATVTDPEWDIVASADFDGDGRADILWRHRPTGRNAVWLMNGTTPREGAWLPAVEDSSWRLAGTGDFDGDGRADVVWAQPDGFIAIWLLDGGAFKGSSIRPSVSAGWNIVGIGDVNLDGKSDLLLRHAVSGANAVWLMDGNTIQTQILPTVPGVEWQVAAFSDLNGDGRADVIWRNTARSGAAAGQTTAWLLSGAGVSATGALPTVDEGVWHLEAVRDTDGDARGDVIWVSRDRQLARWRMNGLTIQGGDVFATVSDALWRLK